MPDNDSYLRSKVGNIEQRVDERAFPCEALGNSRVSLGAQRTDTRVADQTEFLAIVV